VPKHSLVRLLAGSVMFVLAGVGIASAQTTTASTNSSTVAQAPAPKKDPPKHPIAIVHITPQWTFMLGSSDLPRPDNVCGGGTCGQAGNFAYAQGQTRLGYGVNFILTPKVTLNYVHNYINQTLGRVTTATGAYSYQVFNDDRVDDINLAFPISGVGIAVGYHQRVRMCCGNAGGAANGNIENWWYAQATKRFIGNSKYFGPLIGITANASYIPHPACSPTAGSNGCKPALGLDGGNKIKWTGAFNVTYPVGGRNSSFGLFGTYTNSWDYFWNQPGFFLYNEADYGFIKKFGANETLFVMNSNLYQHPQGFPFVAPNTINRDKLLISMHFALPVY
jgi:hypothetical protein